jgi:hypothetical protein
MSRISFNSEYNGKPIEVCAGWDNPIQYFFMTIFSLYDEEEIVWDELRDYDFPQLKTTKLLKDKLEEMNIASPPGFWDRVELCERNVNFHFGAYLGN